MTPELDRTYTEVIGEHRAIRVDRSIGVIIAQHLSLRAVRQSLRITRRICWGHCREYRLAIGIRSEGDEIGVEIGGGEKLGMDFEPDCPSLPPGTPPL